VKLAGADAAGGDVDGGVPGSSERNEQGEDADRLGAEALREAF
jgi:hypothetical protein